MRTTRKSWTPAQFTCQEARGWGVSEKNRGAVDIFVEFPVSPETENSHWLKGGSVMSLTTADHDCLQAVLQFARVVSCVLRWNARWRDFQTFRLSNQLFRKFFSPPSLFEGRIWTFYRLVRMLCQKECIGDWTLLLFLL